MSWLAEPQAWVALVTLTALELVLGIDNIIFISILTGKLPPSQRQKGRMIGLALKRGSSLAWTAHQSPTAMSSLLRASEAGEKSRLESASRVS